jgi:hypothetical protein
VTQLLRLGSPDAYRLHRNQLVADARALVEIGLMSADQCKKFIDFTCENPDDFSHGLWLRVTLGISSCSNHAESFHSIVQQALKARMSLPEKIGVIIQCIDNKFDSYGKGRPRQIREALAKLKKYGARQVDVCSRLECIDFRLIMQSRFGVPAFPCKHTVINFVPDIPSLPKIERLAHFPNLHLTETVSIALPEKFLRHVVTAEEEPVAKHSLKGPQAELLACKTLKKSKKSDCFRVFL